jgi:hypothetical protein
MTFDSNTAWKDATAAVAANREVLLALAGVFYFLPSLAFALLYPQPTPPTGMASEAMGQFLLEYYQGALPLLLPATILQAVATLAILTLFTDRTRPTVGEALKQGAIGLIPFILAQLLLGLGFGLAGGLLIALVAATGVAALAVVVVLGLLAAAVYVYVRTSLLSPVIAVERARGPVAALKRSWVLTQGNAGRLLLFYLLLGIAYLLLLMIVMGVIGVVLALVVGGRTAEVVAAVVSSGLTSVATLYFVAVVASAHRQLAGPSGEAVAATFE